MFNIISQKTCTKCGETKLLDQFYKRKDKKDGRGSECKVCHAARNSKFRWSNPDKSKEYSRKWKAANHDQVIESSRRYHRENKEKDTARTIKWRSKNREKAREIDRRWYWNHQSQKLEAKRKYDAEHTEHHVEYMRLWREKNPEKLKALLDRRRSREKDAAGNITRKEWKDLKKRYNHTCLCCKRREPEIKLTLDHVIPLAKGGEHSIENAQPLCKSCNCRKHTKIIDYRK